MVVDGEKPIDGKKKFPCEKCEKSYLRKVHLVRHTKSVHDVIKVKRWKRFKCEKCDKSFFEKGVLKRHLKSFHDGIKDHKCDQCQKEFIEKDGLKRHLQSVHEAIKEYKCVQCPAEFNLKESFRRHLKFVHDGTKKHKCKYCPSLFKRKDSVNLHLKRVHKITDSEKPSQSYSKLEPENTECDDSDKAEITVAQNEKVPNTKDVHITIQTSQSKILKCDACSESFNSRFNLRKHKATVHEDNKKFKCEECPSSFGQKLHLKIHVKRKHLGYSEDYLKQSTETDFNFIENTPKMNSNDDDMKTKRNIQVRIDSTQNQKDPEENKYKCRFCTEAFVKKSDVQTHVTDQHFEDTIIVETRFESLKEDDSKRMDVKGNHEVKLPIANEIIAVNPEECKPNVCKTCQKSYSSRQNLKNHINEVHFKIKNHKCNECGKPFSQNKSLKRHMELVHEKQKKFKCEHCMKAFSQKGNMKRHITRFHSKLDSSSTESVKNLEEAKDPIMNVVKNKIECPLPTFKKIR